MNKKSIKDLIIEHNDLKKDSQVSNDAFENEINKKNDKKDLKNLHHGKPKHGKLIKNEPDGKNRRKH